MKIKIIKCSPSLIFIIIAMFLIIALLNFLDIDIHSRSGIHKANLNGGIEALFVAFSFYLFSKWFCVLKEDEESVYKCESCKEVFSELDIKDKKCPKCEGKMIEINKYYKKSNKYERL
jgi:DNA-directed RNA polymerase subunit RPC12/RpoP